MELLFLFSGIISGVVIGYLLARAASAKNLNTLQTEKAIALNHANNANQRIKDLEAETNQSNQRIVNLVSELASGKNENENLAKQIAEKQIELETLNQKLKAEFEVIANKILDEKSQKFANQNKENIDHILSPIKLKIESFEKKVEETYRVEAAERNTLKGEIKNLFELSQQMNQQAKNLASALKGENKIAGNWGEMILESILEKSGLVKGREYFPQESFTTDDGRRVQPDVVVRLPENKNVIIDSKVSLVAYDQYCAAQTEDERAVFLSQHIQSIKNHIKDLGGKQYQQIRTIEGLDYVIMFIPIEPAFNLAMQNDTGLWNEAFDRNIVMVSTSTLWAVLRTIAGIWKQEKQNNNALEIARLSGSLYDKFVGFTDDMIDIGRKIDQSKSSYVDAMKKLTEGNGNLVRNAEKIKELGAKSSKNLNPGLLQRGECEIRME